jgi:hypothetical protein
MKPLLLALAGLVVATMAAPRVAAAQATSDSVTSVAWIAPEGCDVVGRCFAADRYLFDVHSGPAGENASGTVTFVHGERLGLTVDVGTVTCLAVHGQTASIGVNFAGLGPPGEHLDPPHSAIVFVADLGGAGEDRLSVQDLASGPGTAPSVCPPSPPIMTLGPTYPSSFYYVVPGESVTVTDAQPPLPTSKDQCKQGGWAQFGFKNEGQCVAFVERGAKG